MFANITENKEYRNEYKYIISTAQMAILQSKLKNLLPIDKKVKGKDYKIRSLYFDNYDNKCFFENENGVEPREKYRLRIYNEDAGKIFLEIKKKEQSKIIKYRTEVTPEQAQKLLNGEKIDYGSDNEILKYISAKIQTELYHPVIVVDYTRRAYEIEGQIRITLDTNIVSSKHTNKFFEKSIIKRPILPVGMQIMEIKFGKNIPKYILNVLQTDNLNLTKFSKYYLSRCYSI